MMMKLVLLSVLLASGCSQSQPRTPSSPAPPSASVAPPETGAATQCRRDEDCACHRFDGARFQDGREPSTCCSQEAGCADAMGATVAINHCMTCVYD